MQPRTVRRIFGGFFLALFVVLSALMGTKLVNTYPATVFLEIDPLHGLATTLATGVLFSGLLLGLVVIGLTLLLGRVWCSWICPLGVLQDCTGVRPRDKTERAARLRNRYRSAFHLKYGLLIAFLVRLEADVVSPEPDEGQDAQQHAPAADRVHTAIRHKELGIVPARSEGEHGTKHMREHHQETDAPDFFAARKPRVRHAHAERLGRPEGKGEREQDKSRKAETFVQDVKREIFKGNSFEDVIADDRVCQRKQENEEYDLYGLFRHNGVFPSLTAVYFMITASCVLYFAPGYGGLIGRINADSKSA